jgi:hypothetical protein
LRSFVIQAIGEAAKRSGADVIDCSVATACGLDSESFSDPVHLKDIGVDRDSRALELHGIDPQAYSPTCSQSRRTASVAFPTRTAQQVDFRLGAGRASCEMLLTHLSMSLTCFSTRLKTPSQVYFPRIAMPLPIGARQA